MSALYNSTIIHIRHNNNSTYHIFQSIRQTLTPHILKHYSLLLINHTGNTVIYHLCLKPRSLWKPLLPSINALKKCLYPWLQYSTHALWTHLQALAQCAEKQFGSWEWMCPKWTITGCDVTFQQVYTSFRINSAIYTLPLSSTSPLNWTMGWAARVWFQEGESFFSSPQCPDWLWGTLSLLPKGNQGSFSGYKVARAWSWPLTSIYCPIHLHGMMLD
jgi:hypothetical protein